MYLDHFPSPLSLTKHVPQVGFLEQISRKEQKKCEMSDSCFSIELLDKARKKAQGMLHFGQATAIKLPVMKRMKMTEDMPILPTEVKTNFMDI